MRIRASAWAKPRPWLKARLVTVPVIVLAASLAGIGFTRPARFAGCAGATLNSASVVQVVVGTSRGYTNAEEVALLVQVIQYAPSIVGKPLLWKPADSVMLLDANGKVVGLFKYCFGKPEPLLIPLSLLPGQAWPEHWLDGAGTNGIPCFSGRGFQEVLSALNQRKHYWD